jgi:hypothetical protein
MFEQQKNQGAKNIVFGKKEGEESGLSSKKATEEKVW